MNGKLSIIVCLNKEQRNLYNSKDGKVIQNSIEYYFPIIRPCSYLIGNFIYSSYVLLHFCSDN